MKRKGKLKILLYIMVSIVVASLVTQERITAKTIEVIDRDGISVKGDYKPEIEGCYEYTLLEKEEDDDPTLYYISGFCQQYDESGNPIYTELVIPEMYNGYPVEGIGRDAFANHTEIKSVTAEGDELKVIGWMAFSGCTGLEKIVIPASVMGVWDAFQGCTNLSEVEFQGIPEFIRGPVFQDTKWVKECKRKGIAAISNKILLDGTDMKGDVVITGGEIQYIVPNAFKKNKKITSLKLSGIDRIGTQTFVRTNLESIEVKNVKEMETWMFSHNRKLKKAVLDNVKQYGEGNFAECPQLKEVHWGMDTLPEQTFRDCKKLKKVYFSTKKKIKWPKAETFVDAFAGCKNTHIYLSSKKIDKSIKNLSGKSFVLHVPKKAVKKCKKLTDCKVVAWNG